MNHERLYTLNNKLRMCDVWNTGSVCVELSSVCGVYDVGRCVCVWPMCCMCHVSIGCDVHVGNGSTMCGYEFVVWVFS